MELPELPMAKEAIVFGIPLGSWELRDDGRLGRWHPNPKLKMPPEQQRERNVANGYDCPY